MMGYASIAVIHPIAARNDWWVGINSVDPGPDYLSRSDSSWPQHLMIVKYQPVPRPSPLQMIRDFLGFER